MSLFKSILLAAALLVPAAVSAAPVLVYSGSGAGLFDGQFADFFGDDGDGTDIAVVVDYSGATLVGSLLVSDSSGTLLESGSIIDVMFDIQSGPDSVTLLFDTLSGSASAFFNNLAQAVFSFSLEDADDGGIDPVGVAIFAPAPIPLPASVALLVLGLGALAGLKRRRA